MYTSLFRDIEHFGNVKYDKRTMEYDDCKDVGEVIEKIRNGDNSWKSDSLVKQVPCEPVYEWDGKFYKDEASAKAGSTAEEIMKPSHSSSNAESATDKYEPGEKIKKRGKFKFSSTWNSSGWAAPTLKESNGAWLTKSGGFGQKDQWIQMETVSGSIEMIKGVVTQGRHNAGWYVKKFKVYASRNGDSWKELKNSSNQTEFTGNSDHTTEVNNYFNEPVEAKYIRIYPTDYTGHPAMRVAYIKDKSGTVKCIGGDGMFTGTPWFRFKFNKEKTRTHGVLSEGTATKVCPEDGSVMVRQKGNITMGDNNIPVGDLKIIQGGQPEGLVGVMAGKGLTGCGGDPTNDGWFSTKESGASPQTWGPCVKPDNSGLEGTTAAWNTNDGGFQYMYKHWQGSNNNGYNKWINNMSTYKTNGHNSTNFHYTSNKIPTTFTIADYEKVNVIRQKCNRGTKGVVPTLSTGWTSSICSCEGKLTTTSTGGYTGTIYNITGGTEGWIAQSNKNTWANFFNGALKSLVTAKYSSGSFQAAVNNYKVVEKEGTTQDDNYARWSSEFSGAKSAIDGTRAWHCSSHNSAKWNTKLDFNRSVAKYDQSTEFIPIGIKIQPRNSSTAWSTQSPTEIRLVWSDGTNEKEQKVTLGTFATKSTIKTILINPNKRTKTKKLHVYSRHGRNGRWVSFRINYLIGESGGKSIDKGTIDCKNDEPRPVNCKDGAAAGVESSYGGWTNRSVSWSYDSECTKNSNNNWSRKKKKVDGQQGIRYYKVSAPQHGGKNNCTRKVEDTRYRDVTDGDSCSWSYKSGVNEACYWIGSSASYYGARDEGNWTSAASAATQCKTLTNTKSIPYCQFLHSNSENGIYSLEARGSCSPQTCHRPGSGKCNTHGGWGGWMVD